MHGESGHSAARSRRARRRGRELAASPGEIETMRLGVNLSFAVMRLTEPEAWAEFVRADLGLDTVQFTFDLLDPWWPEVHRRALIRRVRAAAQARGLTIGSACAGRTHHIPARLLDPDPAARSIARRWWRRACDVAGELGATAIGGPLGSLTDREAASPAAPSAGRYHDLLDSIEDITCHAAAAGIRELLIEPAPLAWEFPSTITQCQQLLHGLQDRCPIPAGLTLDIGRALFEPRYGPQASAESWISALGTGILMLRVDNTGRRGDPRWGWPHEQGRIGLAPIAASIRAAGLDGIPTILRVCPRFEDDEAEVGRALAASVAYCRQYLGIAPAHEAREARPDVPGNAARAGRAQPPRSHQPAIDGPCR
jgi:D-erythrulose 1-phosphate 3-epimerase